MVLVKNVKRVVIIFVNIWLMMDESTVETNL